MSAFDLLGIAIGVVFVYLLLSLICTALYELVEAQLKRRAADLMKGLRDLLEGDSSQAVGPDSWIVQVYRHPLISSLYNDTFNPTQQRNLPSYIPSRNFALALMDVVYHENDANKDQPLSIQAFRTMVSALPAGHLRQALLTLIDSADNDLERLRKNIEKWYDGTMDRVSGWYKRRAQKILFGMGLVLAILLNADTFAIAATLAKDVNAREALVAVSQSYVEQAQTDASAAPAGAQIASCATDANSPECRFERNLAQLRALPLPLGWDRTNPLSVPSAADGSHLFWAWLIKTLGWLCTALAISLGSPFWFDVLNKLMVIRSTVKPTEKSPDESSEDRQRPVERPVLQPELQANR